MSITLTSLTDLMAFLLGSMSTLPAVQYFCEYAAASISLIYAIHVTCYPALLALDERRRAARRCDVLCCLVVADGAPKQAEAGEATPVRTGLEPPGARGRVPGLDRDDGGLGEGTEEGDGQGEIKDGDKPPPKRWVCEDAVCRRGPGRRGENAVEAVKGDLGFGGPRQVTMAAEVGAMGSMAVHRATPSGSEDAAGVFR